MKISIIIPIYNGHNCIIRCLDSICSNMPSNSDFEILVVDDCSTDDTCLIVHAYSEIHPQIRLIRQLQNHKQGAARNLGLRSASGDYISFVDGDDIVLSGIATAIEIAKQSEADMVYCSTIHEKSDTDAIEVGIPLSEGECMNGKEFCEKYYNEGVFWYPWGFLIKKSFLLNLNYPFVEDRQCEDRDWMAYVLSSAHVVANSKVPMYRYVHNPDSTCRALKYTMVFDHTASGIRHIRLSHAMKNKCPNLSKTLQMFGIDEIYKSLRLRNLSKFSLSDIWQLYDENHLKPFIPELKELLKTENFPFAVHVVTQYHLFEILLLVCARPLAHIGRTILTKTHK